MNARFLQSEATRFRGMADDTDREATKIRLLAMAVDYEARAGMANDPAEPNADEVISDVGEPDLDAALTAPDEPNVAGPMNFKPSRKIATGLKETVMVERRPVGRPRRV
jgi:hypothetical protein